MSNDASISFDTVEAVRTDWNAAQPPDSGWTPVSLPDDWSRRWPGFDGVVWYRLTWQQKDAGTPVGMLFEYLTLAGAVYLNGSLIIRDPHLVEPLTRAWNLPRYRLLSAPMLKQGTNTLLVRVSGFSSYQPGLGPVTIGDPATLDARYTHDYAMRHDWQLVSLAATATLGCFFLSLWLMRRKETTYGWFSLMSLAWWFVAMNQVVTTTWPFASTDAWEAANSIALIIYSASYTMFTIRFCERRLPRIEIALWLLVVAGAIAMLIARGTQIGEMRALLSLAQALNFFAASLVFLWFAIRRGQTDHRILAVTTIVFVAAGLHDLLSFLGVLRDNFYFTALTAQLQVISMALVLAWRFVANLRRIERFNVDLHAGIETARAELAHTLTRQHELEVVNVRLSERLNLAQDLHDGLGGTLVSSIATLEHAPQGIPPGRFLSILKELRDDLRIIIDTASTQERGEASLADQIGPLRHRLTRLFETQGVACHWRISGIERRFLPASQSLDVLRILQEALTNAFRHSGASRVDVVIDGAGDALVIRISDNGKGFDASGIGQHAGTGMRSMRARVQRLGGEFSVRSSAGQTVIELNVPDLSAELSDAGVLR